MSGLCVKTMACKATWVSGFPGLARKYRKYESIPKAASIVAKRLTLNTNGAGNPSFAATGAGAPGGMRTVIKKTGGRQPGILSYALAAEWILKPMAINTGNTVPGDAL